MPNTQKHFGIPAMLVLFEGESTSFISHDIYCTSVNIRGTQFLISIDILTVDLHMLILVLNQFHFTVL